MPTESAAPRVTVRPIQGVIVELSPEEEARLHDLARKIGGDRTEVFRRALGLLSVAVRAREEGKRVGILDAAGNLDTEITGF